MQGHVIILPIDGINAIKQCHLYREWILSSDSRVQYHSFSYKKKSQWLSKSYDAFLSNNKKYFVNVDKKTMISLSFYT